MVSLQADHPAVLLLVASYPVVSVQVDHPAVPASVVSYPMESVSVDHPVALELAVACSLARDLFDRHSVVLLLFAAFPVGQVLIARCRVSLRSGAS